MNRSRGPDGRATTAVMPYVPVPVEYQVAGPFGRYVWHGFPIGIAWYLRDGCVGGCAHPYERLRRAPDGALWDGAGGSPIGADAQGAASVDPDLLAFAASVEWEVDEPPS